MSTTSFAAILLTVISINLTVSTSHLNQPEIASQCAEHDSICELNQLKLMVSQLEAMLEERIDNLESRSNNELTAETLKLESHLNDLRDVELLQLSDNEAVSSLENEVRSLWAKSRKNNFDIHMLESKAVEAEERLEDAKSKVDKMADIVTEQWIQYRHLEQALQGVQIKVVDAERQICLQKCSFVERLPLLLDQQFFKHFPGIKLYCSEGSHQVNMFISAVKTYHLQLQQFVRHEIEKTRLKTVSISEELVFFVASALLILPVLCTLMMLLSLFH